MTETVKTTASSLLEMQTGSTSFGGHQLSKLIRVLVLLMFRMLTCVNLSGFARAGGQEIPISSRRMHTLFSVECNAYFDWQTVGLMHSFRKAGQPGPITRLLSCTDDELKNYKNLDIAPTHVVPSLTIHPVTGDIYPAINKPVGILHWLTHADDSQNVDWVVILDADMIMRRPMIPWELGVQKGKPVAAHYGYLVGCESTAVLAMSHTRHPELCDKVGGFLLHHIDDLRSVAPLWFSKTEEVRADKEHYATKYTGDIYEHGWISEMYGYSFGAAEIGLRHQITNDIMIYPGYIPREGVEPLIMHYGIQFNVSTWHFSKSEHRADAILEDCDGLFPAPPYPHEVESITEDPGARRAHHLSIECINTINEALVLHHSRRNCPETPQTEYLEFLLAGSAKSHAGVFNHKRGESDFEVKTSAAFQDKATEHPNQNPKIHTVFSTECNDYFDWQTLGIYHSFQLSGQPGFITRLLSCTDDKLKSYHNLELAPTHVVPSYSVHPLTGDQYPAINKPAAVYHWLSHVHLDVDYVVILDADMILRGPILPWELGALKGHPVSASYEYLIGCDNKLAKLHTRYPEYCQKVGGIIVMHIDDLRLLAPIWLHKTEEVRADKAHWATNLTGDIYGNGWISEMYGYSFGAAELKLNHTIKKDVMLYPGYIPVNGIQPRVLHYGLGFTIGNWSWDKHTWHYSDMTSTCWTLFPFPPVPDRESYISQYDYQRDELSFECIMTLNEALVLFHRRNGCKEDGSMEHIKILKRLLSANRSSQRHSRTTNDELDATGVSESDFAEEMHFRVVSLDKESKASTVSENRQSKSSMYSTNVELGRSISVSAYWLMGLWLCLIVLVGMGVFGFRASHFKRTFTTHKERMV